MPGRICIEVGHGIDRDPLAHQSKVKPSKVCPYCSIAVVDAARAVNGIKPKRKGTGCEFCEPLPRTRP